MRVLLSYALVSVGLGVAVGVLISSAGWSVPITVIVCSAAALLNGLAGGFVVLPWLRNRRTK